MKSLKKNSVLARGYRSATTVNSRSEELPSSLWEASEAWFYELLSLIWNNYFSNAEFLFLGYKLWLKYHYA